MRKEARAARPPYTVLRPERILRRGIHRGFESDAQKGAWVAETAGGPSEWLSEAEYRLGGFSPSFDRLPVLTVEVVHVGLVDMDALPPEEREYLQNYQRESKGTKPKR